MMRFKEDKVSWLSGIMLNRASGTIPVTNSVRSRFLDTPTASTSFDRSLAVKIEFKRNLLRVSWDFWASSSLGG